MNRYGKIVATASYTPDLVITNDELSKRMDTSDEWIYSRTGIKERRCAVNETTTDLCIQVAERLLAKGKVSSQQIDFILVATMSPDYTTPSTACMVQGALGADQAFAFDISAACSGFVYALTMAEKLLQTGAACGMVIGGETLSKLLNWEDRSTAVLFGDGAGGVLLTRSSEQHVLSYKLRADGKRAAALTAGGSNNNSPFYEETHQLSPYLTMSGRDIFDFALRDVTKNIKEVTAERIDTVDYFLLHQANERIIEKIAKKLKMPREKFLTNMNHYGNTSAASIPLLLDEAVTAGKIALDGTQRVVFTGYGGGLTWGSILMTL